MRRAAQNTAQMNRAAKRRAKKPRIIIIAGAVMFGAIYLAKPFIPETVAGLLILVFGGGTMYVLALLALRDSAMIRVSRELIAGFKKKILRK